MGALFKVLLAVVAMFAAAAVAMMVVFYYSPSLQRSLVLRGLKSGFGEETRLEYFRAGFDSLEMRGLHVTTGEESFDLERVEARFGFFNLVGDVPEIETVIVSGLDLDLAARGGASFGARFADPKKTTVSIDAPPPHPKAAIRTSPVRIGKIQIDGRVRLPAEREVRFNFDLKDLAPESTATIASRIFIASHDPGQPYQDADLSFSGTISQTAAGMLDRGEGELLIRLRDSPQGDWIETRTQTRFEGSAEAFAASIEQIDLAALSQLAILNLQRPFSSGRMDVDLKGQMGPGNIIQCQLSLSGLRPQGHRGTPFAISVESEFKSDESSCQLQVSAPFTLTGPATVTQGSFAASIDSRNDDLLLFDGALEADVLNVDDWQPVFSVFQSKEPSKAPSGRDPTPDTEAPWGGLEGKFTVEIGRLISTGNALTRISAVAAIEEGERVSVQLNGQSNGTPIATSGTITFDPDNAAYPYTLAGNLQVEALEVTPFLRSADSRHPPMLEGIFDVSGNIASSAPNLSYIADRLTGDLRLDSAGAGIFRPLGENTTVAQGVSGLLGALTGSVKELGWVQMVIDQLEEIPYRQMTFNLSRDRNFNFVLNELDLVSRETRIRGKGIIRFQAEADLLNLPMDMQFQIFAKGRLAEALRTGHQLRSEQPDDLGFLPGPPLPIRGSLGDPESLLVNLLMESTTQLLPGLLKGK